MISSARARRLGAFAAATVLGLTVATAAPASADTRTLKDGKGDTWNVTGSEPKKASGHPEADLRKVVIKHTNRKVVVTARTQNLKKTGDAVGLSMGFDVPGDGSYSASVAGQPGAWGGATSFYASNGSTCEPTGSLNYRTDVITISIPRRCLGQPDWVKVDLYGILVNGEKYFVDNPLNGKVDGGMTRRIAKG